MQTVGIIGYGFVGKATSELRTVAKINIYDPAYSEYNTDIKKEEAYKSDFVFICVPTPEGANGEVDLSVLNETVNIWARYKAGILVIKSTIPAGTTEKYHKLYNTEKIIHNPEFLTERTYIQDFLNPTDVVIGGELKSANKLKELYKSFYNKNKRDVDINLCSCKEAELMKTVRNSFYATKISFMNEIYQLCNRLGINYQDYEKILTNNGNHPWWGPEHTKVPGPVDQKLGFGGVCLPKDSVGLYKLAESVGLELQVLKSAIKVNKQLRPEVFRHTELSSLCDKGEEDE